MYDALTAGKVEEVQGYADRNKWENFLSAIKTVYGLPTKATAPLFRADGITLLTEEMQILKRWAEHFRGVLNCSSVISDTAIVRLPQVETSINLDLPSFLHETIRAVQQLCSGKASGSDTIFAERYKHSGPRPMDHLTALLRRCGVKEKSRKISKTPQSCICISEKIIASSGTTIEASPC
nr:unnamed protein product [Spirometra erinaceieuropaei]